MLEEKTRKDWVVAFTYVPLLELPSHLPPRGFYPPPPSHVTSLQCSKAFAFDGQTYLQGTSEDGMIASEVVELDSLR